MSGSDDHNCYQDSTFSQGTTGRGFAGATDSITFKPEIILACSQTFAGPKSSILLM